jgi:hypothetical protein
LKDLYQGIHGFVSFQGSQILAFKDSIRGCQNESGLQKVQFELLTTNPANFQRFDLF